VDHDPLHIFLEGLARPLSAFGERGLEVAQVGFHRAGWTRRARLDALRLRRVDLVLLDI
jgi:hypothetical protein